MMTAAFKQQQHDYLVERQAAHARLLTTIAAAADDDLPVLQKRLRMVERQLSVALAEIQRHT